METTVAVVDRQGYGGVVNFEEYAMSAESAIRQVALIQTVMSSVMKKDEHYGTIPGTNKPSLLKPGAEKLNLVFRLRPEYEIRRTDLYNGHREYEVTCTLYHIPTGQSVGQGVGSATTMEGKYRYRGGEKEGTGKPVPKEYWNLKKEGRLEEAKAMIGGAGFAPGKINGAWEICSIGEKQEHDNPADYYNTVLKMAKKRAHVDAILTATAASDIFTQDVEDMPEVIPGAKVAQGNPPAPEKPPIREPRSKGNGKAKAEQKAPPPPAAVETVTCQVTDVTATDGTTKDGKPYRVYVIHNDSGAKFSTFSDTFADLARSARETGDQVEIAYQEGQYGKKIVQLSVEAQQ